MMREDNSSSIVLNGQEVRDLGFDGKDRDASHCWSE